MVIGCHWPKLKNLKSQWSLSVSANFKLDICILQVWAREDESRKLELSCFPLFQKGPTLFNELKNISTIQLQWTMEIFLWLCEIYHSPFLVSGITRKVQQNHIFVWVKLIFTCCVFLLHLICICSWGQSFWLEKKMLSHLVSTEKQLKIISEVMSGCPRLPKGRLHEAQNKPATAFQLLTPCHSSC